MSDYYTVKRIDNSRLVRTANPNRFRESCRIVAFGGVLAAGMFLYAWQHFQCLQLGYQLEELKAERGQATEMNQRLKLEVAALKSPTVDELWFLTASDSAKTGEIDATHGVGLSYSDPANQRFVAISGSAQIVRDPATARELWHPAFAAWFPQGPDDPNLRLVCVTPQKAEYWDSSSHRMALLFQTVKAALGGKKPQFSSEEHAKVGFDR